MSYQKARGRSKGSFVMVRHDIMKSEAWRSLSGNARGIWLEIMLRYNGHNNGKIPLSCREAGEFLNISKNTAHKALQQLQDRGFIKVGSSGGFRVKMRYATRWIVTHESCEGKAPTNEWRKWEEY